jgi:hypothetical protein
MFPKIRDTFVLFCEKCGILKFRIQSGSIEFRQILLDSIGFHWIGSIEFRQREFGQRNFDNVQVLVEFRNMFNFRWNFDNHVFC